MTAPIVIRDLSKVYNAERAELAVRAVDSISFAVAGGESLAIIGPSGCGKSSLLNILGCLDRPTEGRYELEGRDMAALDDDELAALRNRHIGFVFQSFNLLPRMSAAENVELPLLYGSVKNSRELARAALERVGLADRSHHLPSELSGGQKQRVAIARALVTHPTVLLLDEPLAALDAKLREDLQIELINLQKEVGITFVYVTHDQTEALALSHRIAVMDKGRVEQVDEPSRIYGFPRTRFVADFIGHCNLFSGPVTANEGGIVTLEVAGLGPVRARADTTTAPGRDATIALRPEKTRLAPAGAAASEDNHFTGTVHDFLYMGDVTVYRIETAAGARVEALLANSGSGRATFFEVGDAVSFGWRADAGHFLEA